VDELDGNELDGSMSGFHHYMDLFGAAAAIKVSAAFVRIWRGVFDDASSFLDDYDD